MNQERGWNNGCRAWALQTWVKRWSREQIRLRCGSGCVDRWSKAAMAEQGKSPYYRAVIDDLKRPSVASKKLRWVPSIFVGRGRTMRTPSNGKEKRERRRRPKSTGGKRRYNRENPKSRFHIHCNILSNYLTTRPANTIFSALGPHTIMYYKLHSLI